MVRHGWVGQDAPRAFSRPSVKMGQKKGCEGRASERAREETAEKGRGARQTSNRERGARATPLIWHLVVDKEIAQLLVAHLVLVVHQEAVLLRRHVLTMRGCVNERRPVARRRGVSIVCCVFVWVRAHVRARVCERVCVRLCGRLWASERPCDRCAPALNSLLSAPTPLNV